MNQLILLIVVLATLLGTGNSEAGERRHRRHHDNEWQTDVAVAVIETVGNIVVAKIENPRESRRHPSQHREYEHSEYSREERLRRDRADDDRRREWQRRKQRKEDYRYDRRSSTRREYDKYEPEEESEPSYQGPRFQGGFLGYRYINGSGCTVELAQDEKKILTLRPGEERWLSQPPWSVTVWLDTNEQGQIEGTMERRGSALYITEGE